MPSRQPWINSRAGDGGLSEVSPGQGLERHVPYWEQKEFNPPQQEEKIYHPPPAELPTENWPATHRASLNTHGSHPSFYPAQPDPIAPQPQVRRLWWKKKLFWIPLALLLVAGAIVGGVVGGLSSHRDTSPDREASTASPTSATATSSSSPVSPGSGSSTSVPSTKPLKSSLASVAWSESGGLVNQRRLYYQDNMGIIKESAWNSTGNTWWSSQDNLGDAKPGSPIAAAVKGSIVWPYQLNLYYLDPNGYLIEKYNKGDGPDWHKGGLTDDAITPSPQSGLASTWSQTDSSPCDECGAQTTLVAYQDKSNDKIHVVNITGSSNTTTLEADTAPGTGLAFQFVWHRKGSAGLRIYYQKGEADLMTIDYEDGSAEQASDDTAGEWTLHDPIGSVASGASIASFSAGINANGDPLFRYTLSSGPQGINVNALGAPRPGTPWQAYTPDIMKNVEPYSAVAANADRRIYAYEDGGVKEFVVSTDGTTWSVAGDVPITS